MKDPKILSRARCDIGLALPFSLGRLERACHWLVNESLMNSRGKCLRRCVSIVCCQDICINVPTVCVPFTKDMNGNKL